MSKLSTQWEKRNTLLKKSKVRFAVLSALMKMVAKPKTKVPKKDIQSIAKIIGTHCYKAFPTKESRKQEPNFETFIGTVVSVRNDVLYSLGSAYFIVLYGISDNGYTRFFDALKSKSYKSLNNRIVFQKTELNEFVNTYIKNNRPLDLFGGRGYELINNFDTYDSLEYDVKTIDVNKAINFIVSNENVILTKIKNSPNPLYNRYFLNLLKIYAALGIGKISIKHPIKKLYNQTFFLRGIDANGCVLSCLLMPRDESVLKDDRYYDKDYGKWIDMSEVLYFDGNWSVVPSNRDLE